MFFASFGSSIFTLASLFILIFISKFTIHSHKISTFQFVLILSFSNFKVAFHFIVSLFSSFTTNVQLKLSQSFLNSKLNQFLFHSSFTLKLNISLEFSILTNVLSIFEVKIKYCLFLGFIFIFHLKGFFVKSSIIHFLSSDVNQLHDNEIE